jgi:hypothetical protein
MKDKFAKTRWDLVVAEGVYERNEKKRYKEG